MKRIDVLKWVFFLGLALAGVAFIALEFLALLKYLGYYP